ncbi:hypothetical protein BDZ45DRAFT_745405 [Acephala macrosclerotiorum]|nr:hypothetical protein BDZ45DRAFT_745405 [Acephala macrosclerotiorum]
MPEASYFKSSMYSKESSFECALSPTACQTGPETIPTPKWTTPEWLAWVLSSTMDAAEQSGLDSISGEFTSAESSLNSAVSALPCGITDRVGIAALFGGASVANL